MNAQRYSRSLVVGVGLGSALMLVLTMLALSSFATTTRAQADTARLRAVHAVPDIFGAPVDIYVNGDEAAANVDFFAATPYLDVPAGETDIAVVPTGGDPDTEAVITATVTLAAGMDYSAVARGTAADDDADLGATLLEDDNTAPMPGEATLRVAHFSPDAPGVDVLVNGTTVITGLEYLDTSAYLPLATGSYTVNVAPTGGSPIFTETVDVEAGNVYTAWAVGLLGEESEDQEFRVAPTVDASYFYLRAVHAVPDIVGSPVDVYVNGAEITTFDFFDTTDYLPLMTGADYAVQVVPEDGDPDSESVISGTLTADLFMAGMDYSLVARGTAADDAADLGATLLEDDNTAPMEGEAKLRVAHFSPDAPAVDILVDGTTVISDFEYLDASAYLPLATGSYSVAVAPAGGSPVLTETLTVEGDKVYTAWANGLLLGQGDQAFKVTPTIDRDFADTPPVEGDANVRVLHASPGAPAVDVLVDGTAVITDLSFGNISEYLQLAAGTYDVGVRATGTTDVVFSTTLTVEANVSYTVAAIGILAGDAALAQDETPFTLQPIVDSQEPPTDESNAKVRLVHLSPDAPEVDLRVGETVLFDDVAYTDVTEYIEVMGGPVSADVTSSDGSQTFLTAELTLPAGSVNSIYAIGLADSAAPEDQQLRALLVPDLAVDQTGLVLYLPIIGN